MIYKIENEKLIAKISTIGATLVSLIDKESGTDIMLGFDLENDYLKNYDPHFGANVGRCANRIAKGHFLIDENEYQLSINNGPNTNHSGVGDLSFRAYSLLEINKQDISFVIEDKDLSGGFPGDLNLRIKYELIDNSLVINYFALSNKKTILNLTNHSYINLNSKISGLKQELKVYSDRVALNDENGMATLNQINVEGTSFDFRDFRIIEENIKLKHPNLSNGGIDHNFVFEKMGPKDMATLRNDKLAVTINSDLPDLHIYTANYFYDMKGKGGIDYHQYHGVALEAQFYPNAINYPGVISPIIDANKEVKHYIKYKVEKRS